MSAVPMNILAYLAIIALLGLIGATVWMGMTVLAIVKKVKGSVALINPARQAILQTVGVAKGIALKSQQRALAMAGHAKFAGGSVMHVKDEIVALVSSIDIDAAKEQAQAAAETVRNGSAVAGLWQQFVDTYQKADTVNRAGA